MQRHIVRFACAAAVLAAAVALSEARDQKTVFHGLPVEPMTGFEGAPPTPPIVFSRVWTYEGFTAPLAGDPVAVLPGLAATDRSGQVALIGGGDGKVVWSVAIGEAAAIGPAPGDGLIYQGTVSGGLVALDLVDGSLRWRATLGGAPLAPPLAAADRLFVVTDTPEIVALDPVGGAVLARRSLPGRPLAPAAGSGHVVVGTDSGTVAAFESATLEPAWSRDLRQAVTSAPIVAGKRVYVATADRALWALRGASGRPSWRQRLGSIVTARPQVIDEHIYIPCWDNDVYVLRERNGHLVGRSRLDHRLSADLASSFAHLFVAPFTEATVLALALPFLGVAGRHDLGVPGEWFTTAPVALASGVTVGWGREAGRLMGLTVMVPEPAPEPPLAPGEPPSTTGGAPGAGGGTAVAPAPAPAAAPGSATGAAGAETPPAAAEPEKPPRSPAFSF